MCRSVSDTGRWIQTVKLAGDGAIQGGVMQIGAQYCVSILRGNMMPLHFSPRFASAAEAAQYHDFLFRAKDKDHFVIGVPQGSWGAAFGFSTIAAKLQASC